MTAKQRYAKIERITKQARANFLKFTVGQEKELLRIYGESSLNIMHNIQRYADKGLIPPENWKKLLNATAIQMRKLKDDLTGIMHSGWVDGVKFGTEAHIDALIPVVPFEFQPELMAGFAAINKTAVEMLLRRGVDGLTLSERLWDLSRSNLVRLKRDIGIAVATGKSADKLAKEINTYMTYTGKKGRGIYMSEYKNARRIARTELNRAFREGSVRYAQEKKFIVGQKWHATTGACDVCAGMDGNEYYKPDMPPDLRHPHCMCYLTDILDKKLFEKPEKEWQPVADDKYIDEWAKDSEFKDWVYHGTNIKGASKILKTGFKVMPYTKNTTGRMYGDGFYLSPNENFAKDYSRLVKGAVVKAKVNIKNPYKLDFKGADDRLRWKQTFLSAVGEFEKETGGGAITKYLQKRGYDSVMVRYYGDRYYSEMVIFDKKQMIASNKIIRTGVWD